MRGDDHAGSFIAKSLIKNESQVVKFFDGQDTVESIVSRIAALNPKQAVFIDTCEMNLRAGEIRLVTMNETDYPFFTTHGIPMKLIAERFLPNAQSWVLAIQPEQLELTENLSPVVADSVKSVIEFINATMMEEKLAAS